MRRQLEVGRNVGKGPHDRTHAAQQEDLFDYLVGASLHIRESLAKIRHRIRMLGGRR